MLTLSLSSRTTRSTAGLPASSFIRLPNANGSQTSSLALVGSRGAGHGDGRVRVVVILARRDVDLQLRAGAGTGAEHEVDRVVGTLVQGHGRPQVLEHRLLDRVDALDGLAGADARRPGRRAGI